MATPLLLRYPFGYSSCRSLYGVAVAVGVVMVLPLPNSRRSMFIACCILVIRQLPN